MIRATLVAALFLAAAPSAFAEDAAVIAARAAGQVGESVDGYMGVRPSASPDVRAKVDQINIKRRAAFTDLAAKKGVSVSEVAATAACQLLDATGTNEWWRDAGGEWRQRVGGAPVPKPAYCG